MGMLRVLLAMAVVLTHTGGIAGYNMVGGRVAVETFFVLSGFLIQMMLATRYAGPGKVTAFWRNRALRILPGYYLALAFALGLYAVIPHNPGSFYVVAGAALQRLSFTDWLVCLMTQVLVVGQEILMFCHVGLNGLAFGPDGNDPLPWSLAILPPAWSLSLELVFYMLAPALARLRTGPLAILAVLGLALKYGCNIAFFQFTHPWNYRFLPFELPYFLFGMLAWRLRPRLETDRSILVFAMLCLTVLFQPLTERAMAIGIDPEAMRLAYLVLIVLGLPTLFCVSQRLAWDQALGNYSYPVYLFHWPIALAVITLAPRLETEQPACFLVILAATVLVSHLCIQLLERPISSLRRLPVAKTAEPPLVAEGI